MGLACSALTAPDLVEEFREMVRKAADQWVDGFAPLFELDKAPELFALSEHVQATRLEFFAACMKAAVEKLYAAYLEQEWADCPLCEKPLHRKRVEPKTISTAHGQFTLGRPYFYCGDCQHGFSPLDEALGLAPGRHQYDVQKRVTLTAAEVPFEKASEMIEQLTGLRVGNACTHDTLVAVAKSATIDRVLPDREEIERRIAQAAGDKKERPVLVVSSDGAHGRTRPKARRNVKRGNGQYKEIKGFRIYLLTPEDRVISVASWHEFQDSQTLGDALAIAAERIPQERVRVCLIGDGASWVWTEMVRSFPNAKQILDFYHCFEHLHVVARSQWGIEGEPAGEGRYWAERNMVRLCAGDKAAVLADLRQLEPRTEDTDKEIRKLIVYLNNHAGQINYYQDLEDGYPIGSGAMESANKFICHTRLKRSGAWWVIDTGNDMLRIRCAIHNGTFDQVFQHHMKSTAASTRRRKTRRTKNE